MERDRSTPICIALHCCSAHHLYCFSIFRNFKFRGRNRYLRERRREAKPFVFPKIKRARENRLYFASISIQKASSRISWTCILISISEEFQPVEIVDVSRVVQENEKCVNYLGITLSHFSMLFS